MSTHSRSDLGSPAAPASRVGQRIAGSRRRLRRSVALSAALYTAAIMALTLLPGWLMAR